MKVAARIPAKKLRCPRLLLALACAAAASVDSTAQSRVLKVVFEIQTSSADIGGATDDQITILFCNQSSDQQRTPPRPIFNEDIVAEFSFSGREARPGATFTFGRLVSNPAFLNARFIRVVNHGVDGWAGSTLSITVDGQRLLDRVSLYPRKGASSRDGIQKYNPVHWYERVYWEGEVQKLRLTPRGASN